MFVWHVIFAEVTFVSSFYTITAYNLDFLISLYHKMRTSINRQQMAFAYRSKTKKKTY